MSCEWYDVPCHLDSFFQLLENFVGLLFKNFMGVFLTMLEAIPVPDFLNNVIALPSGVSFFLGFFEFATGLGIIGVAYTARFIIRRIPVIG